MLADILSAYGCGLYNMVVCSKQNKKDPRVAWSCRTYSTLGSYSTHLPSFLLSSNPTGVDTASVHDDWNSTFTYHV